MDVKPIPDGYQTVIPYLIVPDPAAGGRVPQRAFAATEMHRMKQPSPARSGTPRSRSATRSIMMGQARGEWPPMPCGIYLYVDDTDAAYARALEAGATTVMAPADQFYGDRNAGVKDAAGNLWWMATHVEDVSPEEMKRRHEARLKGQAAA